MSEAPAEIVFDPHVSQAIVCLLLALFFMLLAFVFGMAERAERRK